MEVRFVPDIEQEAFIRNAIESGRLYRPEDAMQEAMALWNERERYRSEILAAIDEAEVSIAEGRSRRVTSRAESVDLAEAIKKRCLDRLTASKQR